MKAGAQVIGTGMCPDFLVSECPRARACEVANTAMIPALVVLWNHQVIMLEKGKQLIVVPGPPGGDARTSAS